MSGQTAIDAQRLEAALSQLQRVAIAFSGGVDSSVVAAAAAAADLQLALAVTADSPSVPRWQIGLASRVADEIGIEHHLLPTSETTRGEYRRNDKRRCFFCKETLYTTLASFLSDRPGITIVSGTNADDLGDYRPGIDAGNQLQVVTPLADLGFTKTQVRALAAHYGLSNCDLPASPCLASRIAYGIEVTADRLGRIERAEDWLRQQGLDIVRVRLHADELARIEVPREQIPLLMDLDQDGALSNQFQEYGFRYVTIDLLGFRSGSMNRVLVPLTQMEPAANRPSRQLTPSAGEHEVSN